MTSFLFPLTGMRIKLARFLFILPLSFVFLFHLVLIQVWHKVLEVFLFQFLLL